VGAKDRKISLENAKHKCPKCRHHDSVQLTRFENELVICNRKIGLSNHMNVLYNCKHCNWKSKALPDDDPSFAIAETTDDNFLLPDIFVGSKNTDVTLSSSFNSSEDSSCSSPDMSRRSSVATCWRKKGLSLKRKKS
jgi:hypothetical protein